MKKITILIAVLSMALFFTYCNHTKKIAVAPPVVAKITYEANIKPLVVSKCAPCHTTGGFKKAYDSYDNAKADITDIIQRVSRNPGDMGFMPARHDKLSDSSIVMLTEWKTDGLIEK